MKQNENKHNYVDLRRITVGKDDAVPCDQYTPLAFEEEIDFYIDNQDVSPSPSRLIANAQLKKSK